MIDSHCHLDFPDFNGRREVVVREAVQAGVHTIINIGTDVKSSQKSIQLAERFENVYAVVGFHPHDAKNLTPDNLIKVRKMSEHARVVAIGEIGLDYYRNYSPPLVQQEAFRQQLELAGQTGLPVVIHTREAFRDTVKIVKEFIPGLAGGVFHCFPGSVEEAREVIDLGFVISVGGVITYSKSKMAEMVKDIPLEKVLLETDAPFLTPVPHRGKKNHPAYIKDICVKLAELRLLPVAEVEKQTDRACQKLFRLVETLRG